MGKGLSLDFIGFITVIIGTSSLLTSFSQSHSWGWTSWKTILLMLVGIIMIGFFIIRSLKSNEPLLNLRLFQIPRFTYSLILNCSITNSLYSGTFIIPIYLQKIQHESTLYTGLVMLPGTLAMALVSVSLFSTILSSRTLDYMGKSGAKDSLAASRALTFSIQDLFIIGTILVVIAVPLTFFLREKNHSEGGLIIRKIEGNVDEYSA
ncbi:hypothetical protein HQN89_30405 [Paenibacillus frigoriresistens]|nr:hypothetical protein [Paenibacillus frigoriresistens]